MAQTAEKHLAGHVGSNLHARMSGFMSLKNHTVSNLKNTAILSSLFKYFASALVQKATFRVDAFSYLQVAKFTRISILKTG